MLTFHIIYTPGTAIGLSLLATSLLREPSCRFKIISNGCSESENDHLIHLCARVERFEFVRLPTDRIWLHPRALNYLHERHEEPRFAIVDSDVFATGLYLPDSFQSAVTCIAPPATFWTEKDEANQVQRRHMGCTYFAVYDSQAVASVRRETGIGFEKYQWDSMTPEQRNVATQASMKLRAYDTGKLLNAELRNRGGHITYGSAANLRHLGGTSRAYYPRQGAVRKIVRQLLIQRILATPRQTWSRMQRRKRKTLCGAYFADLFAALDTGAELPAMPKLGSRYVEAKARAVTTEILALHAEGSP